MEQLPDLESLVAWVSRHEHEPLELLTDAVILSGRLDEMADQLVDHFVQNARRSDASWADIGQAIGVSKQAAQKRFARRGPRLSGPGRGLFTRFASSARSVVKKAVEYAHSLDSPEIGTLHLVAALTEAESGETSRGILADLCGDVDAIHDAALQLLGDASEITPTSGHIPFASETKKALELSLREAIRDGSRHIGTEHLLLGILRDKESDGAELLQEHEVSREAVQTWLAENPADDG